MTLWCRHQWIALSRSVDSKILKRGGSPNSDLDFLWRSGLSGKVVRGERVCALNYCSIAKWSRVAKGVNILLYKQNYIVIMLSEGGTACHLCWVL